MSASRRFKRSGRRIVDHYRDPLGITLTRTHSVRDTDGRMPLAALELSGEHLSGVTSLTLKAPDDGPLQGVIPKNLVITIDSVEYTAQADATATANAFAVSISPALASTQAADASAALGDNASYSLTGSYSNVDASTVPPSLAESVSARIKVASAGSPVTPATKDLVTGRGRTDAILAIQEMPGGWGLLVGS